MKIIVSKFWLLAAIAWCVVIFMFSNAPANVSAGQSSSVKEIIINVVSSISNNKTVITDFAIRKTGHVLEYTLLGALLALSLYPYNWSKRFIIESSLFCLAFSVIYACTDELHQYFISGRSMRLTDVFIDSAGALFGIIVIRVCMNYIKKSHRI